MLLNDVSFDECIDEIMQILDQFSSNVAEAKSFAAQNNLDESSETWNHTNLCMSIAIKDLCMY